MTVEQQQLWIQLEDKRQKLEKDLAREINPLTPENRKFTGEQLRETKRAMNKLYLEAKELAETPRDWSQVSKDKAW